MIEPFGRSSELGQDVAELREGQREARVELDAFGDQVEGFVVSAARLRHHRLPVIGPIRRGLFFKHAIELFLRPIEISPRIFRQRIQRRLGQRHAHAQQGLRELGLAPKCFLEQRQLFGDVLAAGTAEMDGQSSHQKISDGRLALRAVPASVRLPQGSRRSARLARCGLQSHPAPSSERHLPARSGPTRSPCDWQCRPIER